MNFRTKGIPGFQFKVRFNSSPEINSWEAWTYRAGDTVGTTAKWMQVSKDTAAWYQEAKGAIVETFVPPADVKRDKKDADILMHSITDALTPKKTDSPEIHLMQSFLATAVDSFIQLPLGSVQEKRTMEKVHEYIDFIRAERIRIDPITDWSKEMIAFDDSNITEL